MSTQDSSRVTLITGANGQIGRAYAHQMLEHDHDVILGGRRLTAVEAVASELRAQFPKRRIQALELDVGSPPSMRQAATSLRAEHGKLDVLLHGAGVYFFDKTLRHTPGGDELNWGTHVAGPHALTLELLPLLEASPEARVVLVSSSEHRRYDGDIEEALAPPRTEPFDNMRAYNRSKWAGMLLAHAWSRRFGRQGSPTRSLAAHPGVSITGIQHRGKPNALQRGAIWLMGKLIAHSPADAARPLVLASVQGEAGQFYGPTGFLEASGDPGLVSPLPSTQRDDWADQLMAALEVPY